MLCRTLSQISTHRAIPFDHEVNDCHASIRNDSRGDRKGLTELLEMCLVYVRFDLQNYF